MNLKETLTGWWCDWWHGDGTITRDALGRINWQCHRCGRWSVPVPLKDEEAMTTRDIEREEGR